MKKKIAEKTARAAKEKSPVTDGDLESNCADCPKPRRENRTQPTFTKAEVASLVLIGVLAYSWFVSDWLASL